MVEVRKHGVWLLAKNVSRYNLSSSLLSIFNVEIASTNIYITFFVPFLPFSGRPID